MHGAPWPCTECDAHSADGAADAGGGLQVDALAAGFAQAHVGAGAGHVGHFVGGVLLPHGHAQVGARGWGLYFTPSSVPVLIDGANVAWLADVM